MTQLGFFGEPDDTLARERARLLVQRKTNAGAICGACDQRVKEYHRPLNAGQARMLIFIYMETRDSSLPSYIHVTHSAPAALLSSHDWMGLHYWGFIESSTEKVKTGASTSGKWSITPLGRCVVENPDGQIYSHSNIYNGECLGLDGDGTLRIALGKEFDYAELMRGTE